MVFLLEERVTCDGSSILNDISICFGDKIVTELMFEDSDGNGVKFM